MIIADMHCDSLLTVCESVGLLNEYNTSRGAGHLQLFAEFVPRSNEQPEKRRGKLMRLLDIYASECKRLGIRTVYDCRSLECALSEGGVCSVLSVEGGGGLFADSVELETLFGAGMRVLGIAWDDNELAASAYSEIDTGLTESGRAIVRRASEMGIILDVSHLSDRSASELLDECSYPVLATHSNFREVCPSPRNLPRELAARITERGGVIGINLCPAFLREGGDADISDILRHIDYGLTNFGEDSLGFGFDIDGTGGKYPRGISTEGSIHDRVVGELQKRYSASVVEKLAGGNAIAFFLRNLP